MVQSGAGDGRRPEDAPTLRLVRDGEEPGRLPAVPEPRDPADADVTVVPRGKTVRPRVIAARTVHVITDVATHSHTKAVARHVGYVAVGAHAAAKKLFRSRTASYDAWMDANRTTGDQDHALEWEARRSAYLRDRDKRWNDRVELAAKILGKLHWILGGIFAFLLAIGICLAIGEHRPEAIRDPFYAIAGTVRFVVVVAAVSWLWALALGTVLGVLALWNAGRTRTDLPVWILPPSRRTDDEQPITPSLVVVALRDLGIPALRKAVQEMGDMGAAMLSPIVIAGCGVEVDVSLPSGVTTEEIQQRRRKLAENLGRHEHEVFITIPTAARTVRLWIADSGALDEPIGASPLVYDAEMTADYYTGRAPWGQDLRGEAADISLHQRHVLITGKSNQGKTASLRALLLWLALDPTVEFWIGDLKGVGDWRMFDGLATRLIQGPTDEHVMAVTHMVEDAVEEMNRRLTALELSGATDGVTRDMARAGIGFHPLVVAVDEAQVAFMCPAKGEDGRPYGGKKATSRFFMNVRKIQNQGRAVNVTMHEGTQDPTDENLPKLVREGAHIRGALHLGTEAQAKMALGEGPVDAGAAPHKLRDGLDKGTLVVAGDGVKIPAGQPSITIRTFFVSGADAARIAERAKKRRAPVATKAIEDAEEQRDHLADIAVVMRGEPRVRTEVIRQRLAELDHSYEGWSAGQLAGALAAAGVPIRKSNGYSVIHLADVQQALESREDLD